MKTIRLEDYLKDNAATEVFIAECRRLIAEANNELIPVILDGKVICYLTGPDNPLLSGDKK